MKLNSTTLIYPSNIARIFLVSFVIVLAWTVILFSIGVSRSENETKNLLEAINDDLEIALTQGNVVQVHALLRGLKKFGVESSNLRTPIFLTNKTRVIGSGRLDKTLASKTSSIEIFNNGLYLGNLHYTIDLLSVFRRVILNEWKLLIIILLSHLFTFLALNYIFIHEIRALQSGLIETIKSGNYNNKSRGLVARAILPVGLEQNIKSIADELSALKATEIDLSRLKTERLIARQVAHDIRSPLSAINLILNQVSGTKEVINLLKFSTERINNIASDLLSKSRSSTTTSSSLNDIIIVDAEETAENIVQKITNLISETSLRFPATSINLNIKNSLPIYALKVDLDKILRIISIFLNNSAESFFHNHGLINVNIDFSAHNFQLEVSDNGPGIPKNILSRIGQDGNSGDKLNGNGIGLAYVYKATTLMSGTFDIKSTPSVGTTVTVQLPVREKSVSFKEFSSEKIYIRPS